MINRTILLTDPLYDYLLSVSLRETELMKKLRQETAVQPYSQMQVTPEQAQFLALLVKLIAAKRAIEIGTYTGYSTLAIAQALPDDGQIIACDVSKKFTDIGQRYWQEAGVAHKIELRIALAHKTLAALIENGLAEQIDFVFIDADKTNYDKYYEQCLLLLRPGGLIAIDNVLWSGRVINEFDNDKDTVALRALNQKLHTDDRVDMSLVPIGDGLTLVRKR